VGGLHLQGPVVADEQAKQNGEPGAEGPTAPQIALPKGGGALKSIDEKFQVNPANGTCSLDVPLPYSKTRSGLDGGAALHYDSGAGAGVFGLGWSLALPSIQRRTDKQLPRYEDEVDSDVFLMSGMEDLVPAWLEDTPGHWIRDVASDGDAGARRYRPRIDEMSQRIEKITVAGEAGFFWKVTTGDNVSTIFGRTTGARIADPADPSRIFKWLPEWRYDDKGNCVVFEYKAETLDGAPNTVEEKNRRSGLAPFANRHLKRIRYGNRTPYQPGLGPLHPATPPTDGFFFEAVFDYGEHDPDAPTPDEAQAWPCRFDPFSDCRAGFEIRTYRLCRRILFFHYFTELNLTPGPVAAPCLVRSLDLAYRHFAFDGAPYQSQETDLLVRVGLTHWRRTGEHAYDKGGLPPLELDYQDLAWSDLVQEVAAEDVVNAPAGVGPGSQWLDLYGEGAPGILTEQSEGWFYKDNLGDGHFGPAVLVTPRPSFAAIGQGALKFQDLDADGGKQLVSLAPDAPGYFEMDDSGAWEGFRPFETLPAYSLDDPDVRLLDLDGDGRPDLLVSEDLAFCWSASLGRGGFGPGGVKAKASDEERGPVVMFGEAALSLFLADMSGDGLSDIVRVRNGDICYWPNLGYGRFGAKVTMRDAPLLDHPDRFDSRKVQLADISGTGAADLLYLGRGGATAWINLAGNAWSAPRPLPGFPDGEPPNRVSALDLLGNGTACLVWSSELPASAPAPLRYIDLMGGKKPYLLQAWRNNMGAATGLEYLSSGHYYRADKRAGRPWATKLPFPTMCVSRAETSEAVTGSRTVHEYRYRHGYYDHAEREFRGFGMVEQVDAESFDRFDADSGDHLRDISVHQPPVRQRTWRHTGAFLAEDGILAGFDGDYFKNPVSAEYAPPDPVVVSEGPLTTEERRQAARACKGTVLREETYSDDGSALAGMPYTTARHACLVRMLQPLLGGRYAVFQARESEAVTYHYERKAADPRVAQVLNTAFDEIGNVTETASVVYGRQSADASLPDEVQAEQAVIRITYALTDHTSDAITDAAFRRRAPCETRTFELTGAAPSAGPCFGRDEVRSAFAGAATLAFEDAIHPGSVEKRPIGLQRTLFASDADVNQPLALKALGVLGLPYETYKLAFTPSLLTALYAGRVTEAMLTEAGHVKGDDLKAASLFPLGDPAGRWWTRAGYIQYPANPAQSFYQPDRYVDAGGSTTRVRYYSNYLLFADQVKDALGSTTTALAFDLRTLQATQVQDINDNLTEASIDLLGLVVGTAVKGKGGEADDLTGFSPDPTPAEIAAFLADPESHGPNLLQHATSRFVYSFDAVPAVAASIRRETHNAVAVALGKPSRLTYAFEYSDGLGRVAMTKAQAVPGKARRCDVSPDGTVTITEVDTTPHLRWIGSGRTVLNNKSKPVMKFEPYFSSTPGYETAKALVETGVTPVLLYDPLDRMVRTDFPDGSFSTVAFDAWVQSTSDQNDNVKASDWYAARIGGGLGADEQDAAQKAAVHDGTPSFAHFDCLGRPIYSIEHNRFVDHDTAVLTDQLLHARRVLDIQGAELEVHDGRDNVVMTLTYDMAGRPGHTLSMDAGGHWVLKNCLGAPVYAWTAKGDRVHVSYDLLHRPTQREVLTSAAVTVLFEKLLYGSDRTKNQNGEVVAHYDGSGLVTRDAFDFKRNVLSSARTYTQAWSGSIDWTTPASVPMQADVWTTATAFDALNRATSATSPDGSTTTPSYNESGLLAGLKAAVRGAPAQSFIDKVVHDAKGQRQRIEYANGAVTDFTYDPETFRVRRILTTRTGDGATLQDLAYVYDPAGNVTRVHDQAQQTIYFNNQIVSPDNDFTYDAVYRLIGAGGREHIGGNVPVDRFDAARIGLAHKADGDAMQNYLQLYDYDDAGNLAKMTHNAGLGAFTNRWTRTFAPELASNRLASSTVAGSTDSYGYDLHGNLLSMTGLPGPAPFSWDFNDRLVGVDLGGGGTASYTYDGEGQRARKVIERTGGIVEERLYLGAVEVFTRTQGGTVKLRRETLHIMDGARRLAMVDTRTAGAGGSPAQLIRYQFANHLQTAALELDDAAAIISYEEYYPFGSTSLQSVDSSREVPTKRYRYTGKERDEETGFSYHGARYYAPWLARWTAPDPKGLADGANLYRYSLNNPVRLADPTGTQAAPQRDVGETTIPLDWEATTREWHRALSAAGRAGDGRVHGEHQSRAPQLRLVPARPLEIRPDPSFGPPPPERPTWLVGIINSPGDPPPGEHDSGGGGPPPQEEHEPVAATTFNVTQSADEPGGRTTMELTSVAAGAPQSQGSYTFFSRYAWSHFSAGVSTTSQVLPSVGSTSTSLVLHGWGGWQDRRGYGYNLGAYASGGGGAFLPQGGGAVGTGFGQFIGAFSFSSPRIGVDLNIAGGGTNALQLNDSLNTIRRDVGNVGPALAVTLKDGLGGFMVEGFYNHQFGAGSDPVSVDRYGLGIGGFNNFRLGNWGMLFTGIYGGVGNERGIFTLPGATAPTRYSAPFLQGSLTLGLSIW
jgi:RHS repeat-associated protein